MISKPVVRGRALQDSDWQWGFAVFEAKNAKQRRLIAAILRERGKSLRKRASPARRFPLHAAASNSHGLPQQMADQLTLQGLRELDIPPHFVFAYKRTGLLVTMENEDSMSACDLRRWNAAVLEHFQIERQRKAGTANSTSLAAASQ